MSTPNNDSVHDYYEPGDEREVDVRSLSYVEEKTCQAQKLFLEGFRAGGTIKAGLKVAGVTRRTVERWRQRDKLGFAARFHDAHRDYCDTLEDKMHELIQGLKPGQNSLVLIARLNAEMPEKYRPNAQPIDNAAGELLSEIRKLSRREARVQVEGEELSRDGPRALPAASPPLPPNTGSPS